MKLTISARTLEKKSDTKEVRRQNGIPAVLYGQGQKNQSISVKADELQAALRKIKPGHLSTTVFELDLDGKTVKAVIKDVQYHPTTYAMLHADFLLLSDGVEVSLDVPVRLTGSADCVGVKMGGFLRQVLRKMKVRCLPKNIPEGFDLDVANLEISQSKRLEDIKLPEGVKALSRLKEVAVVITKRA